MSRINSSRFYVFTINNPEGQLHPEEDWNPLYWNYVIWQEEYGSLNEDNNEGSHHFQGYIELTKQQRPSFIHKNFPGLEKAAFKYRLGSQQEAINYCTPTKGKGSDADPTYIDGPWEFGVRSETGTERPKGQGPGRRSDLNEIRDLLTNNVPISVVAQNHFGSFVRYHRGFEEFIRVTRPTVTVPKFPIESFNIPPLSLTKATMIVGSPGFGKSNYAISHFKHCLFVRHIDQLREFNSIFHDGIVFDDMDFSHWPVGARIHLLDMDFDSAIHCRYYNGVIPAGTKRIFCTNFDTIFYNEKDPYGTQGAIDRRLEIVRLSSKVFGD